MSVCVCVCVCVCACARVSLSLSIYIYIYIHRFVRGKFLRNFIFKPLVLANVFTHS